MAIITDLDGFLNHNNHKDYTINNECSNCGNCCTSILPMTQAELSRIKKYVKKQKIKIQISNFPLSNVRDLTCPFRNNTSNKCLIYHIRPMICKDYICNVAPDPNNISDKLKNNKVEIIDMRKEFAQ